MRESLSEHLLQENHEIAFLDWIHFCIRIIGGWIGCQLQ